MQTLSLGGFLLIVLLTNYAGTATLKIITFSLVSISLFFSLLVSTALHPSTDVPIIKFIGFRNIIPIILTIVLSIIQVVIYSNSFKQINDGNVATAFYTFSFYSLILMASQIYTSFASITRFFESMKTDKNAQNLQKNNSVGNLNAITYLLSAVNILYLSTMYVIITYFSTDG